MKKILILGLIASCSVVNGALFSLDLFGNGGFGLLPGNEVGTGANAGNSDSFGGERNNGFVLDTDNNTLEFDFEFTLIGSTLIDAANGGIHIHEVSDPNDPLNSTGGIEFNVNNGDNGQVDLTSPGVAIGASSGIVTGVINSLTTDQIDNLLERNYYVNIHTSEFGAGELRGNIVPEPSTYALMAGAAMLGLAILRRRRQ